jgi:hypothetical protein
MLGWQRWRRPPGPKAIATFAARFPSANIGALTGLSGVTLVDVDEPGLVDQMLARCGVTPLITATPRGGSHLWYRAAGERGGNLRETEGLAVDIKAAGGLIVVPPSVAWIGPAAGKPYVLVKGSWDDLAALPEASPGSLRMATPHVGTVTNLRAVRHGLRNNTLLKLLLRQVRHCDTEADLLDVATTIVDQHFELHGVPPFPPAEIAKTVRSAWQIEQEGRNWVGKEAKLVTTASEFLVLQRNPDAFVLWHALRWMHCARPEPFALSCKVMARDEAIDGWTYPRRYMHARDWLLAQGFLVQEHVGGSKRGDPHLYRLASPVSFEQMGDKSPPIGAADSAGADSAPGMGDETAPNIREHSRPP